MNIGRHASLSLLWHQARPTDFYRKLGLFMSPELRLCFDQGIGLAVSVTGTFARPIEDWRVNLVQWVQLLVKRRGWSGPNRVSSA
jgi:hypothetical protein